MQARGIGDDTRIRKLKKLRADPDPLVLASLEDPRTSFLADGCWGVGRLLLAPRSFSPLIR